jgi:adenylate cyclase
MNNLWMTPAGMSRTTQNLAILFADICESTRLYAKLGDAGARHVVTSCLSLIASIVERCNGRVIKTMGDEVMCAFATADQAVRAAIDMQTAVHSARPGNQPVMIHIGLHFGPVLVENNDVFGDTVNAAAYLTAVAAAEQILTTEATEGKLAPELKSSVRPVFKTILKGSNAESTVYQVVWHKDTAQLTDVNLRSQKIIPGDEGSLLVAHRNLTLCIDAGRPNITIGRGADCDLVVNDKFASRRHCSIRMIRTHFYLVDHSINGTFVSLGSGNEVHVLHGELLLSGAGKVVLGVSIQSGASEIVTFGRDRRSMYRV